MRIIHENYTGFIKHNTPERFRVARDAPDESIDIRIPVSDFMYVTITPYLNFKKSDSGDFYVAQVPDLDIVGFEIRVLPIKRSISIFVGDKELTYMYVNGYDDIIIDELDMGVISYGQYKSIALPVFNNTHTDIILTSITSPRKEIELSGIEFPVTIKKGDKPTEVNFKSAVRNIGVSSPVLLEVSYRFIGLNYSIFVPVWFDTIGIQEDGEIIVTVANFQAGGQKLLSGVSVPKNIPITLNAGNSKGSRNISVAIRVENTTDTPIAVEGIIGIPDVSNIRIDPYESRILRYDSVVTDSDTIKHSKVSMSGGKYVIGIIWGNPVN
jgi:hypothetical protein